MPLMIRANRVMQVPDSEVDMHMSNGYQLYVPGQKGQDKPDPAHTYSEEEFQAAVAAEVEKRMEGIPSQADFEAAVAAEVERRLAEVQPPAQEPEGPQALRPPDEQEPPAEPQKTGGKGGRANSSDGAEK